MWQIQSMISNFVNHLQPNGAGLPRANSPVSFSDLFIDFSPRTITRSDHVGPIARPATELGPRRQRRRLEYVKCEFCRRSKKKVSAVQHHVHPIYPRCGLPLNVSSANPPSVNGQARNVTGVTQRDLPAPRLRRRIEAFLIHQLWSISYF